MKNKLFIILILILSVSLFAQTTTVWNPAGNASSNGLWSEAANWTEGNVPEGDYKVVFNVPGAQDCILDEAHSITKLVMGDGNRGETLRVTNGGSLTTTAGWSAVGWTDTTTLIVETGGTVTFGEHLWIGWTATSFGTVILDGGTINVTQMYGTAFEGGGGKGATYVNSGVLNLSGFDPAKSIPDGSLMDISAGTVNINGDQTTAVNAYIAAGKITAYGGDGSVVVTVADGKTTLTGLPGEPISTVDHLVFDGLNDYVNVGNGDDVNISGSELTLEAWIKANAWKDQKHEGCIINTESAPNNGYMIRAGQNGTLNFNVGNNGWNEINTAEAALQLDTWHHIAATFDGGVQTLYIDGVMVLTVDNSATVTTVGVATSNTFIGNWQSGSDRSFNGAIIDARIWNVARSAEDIIAYKDVTLTGSEEGLAGYWPLNEGDGQVVADLTGNSAGGQLGSTDGPDENDPTWFGQIVVPPLEVKPLDYLVFDGTEQYVDAGNPAALDISGTAITLEALVNMKEWREQVWQGCIINKEQGGAGTDNGYMIRAGANGTVNFNLGSNNWNELNTAEGALQLNQWHHVAATYDGAEMRIYIDGYLNVSDSMSLNIANSSANLFIGSMQGQPSRTVDGSIAEVRIWNVARTHQEIAANMNGSLNGDEAGLAAYWKIDEGEGQMITDLTSNALVGQLGSTPDVDANDPAWGPVTEVRTAGGYMPEFPPTYFQGPFPFGSEPVRFDAPADLNAPSGDGVFHEYTAYRGTPNYDGDDGNLDEDEWNKIPWTLMQFNQEQGQSVYNFDSMIGWSGYTDHTAWFKMLHDDDNVYLAVMKVDDLHTWSDEAWDDTFYLWQCDAIQLQFDARAPGVFDDPMPQAEIGLGSIDDEDAYNYWAGGPGEPVINQQLELAPGSSPSSFASVFGKALHTSVGPHPTEEGLLLETIEAAFVKWDDIMSDDDFAMMMSIITLDRDTVGVGRPASDYFTVFEWGQGLFRKNRTDYASLVLSAGDVPVSVEEVQSFIPSAYALEQNYPNPFNPTTEIKFALAEAGKTKLAIYNVLGQKIATLIDQNMKQGNHHITFNSQAFDLASGIYFYEIKSKDFRQIKKMVLMK